MVFKSLVDIAKALISLARSGWMLRGVSSNIAETVAEHSFLSAFICLDLSTKLEGIDINKTIIYTLIHDIGEAFIGDIVKSFSSILESTKREIELRYVNEGINNEFVKKLYIMYENQIDVESKLAKLCNYIATYITGLEYKRLGYRVNDIIENVYREIIDVARELNIENIVKDFLSYL